MRRPATMQNFSIRPRSLRSMAISVAALVVALAALAVSGSLAIEAFQDLSGSAMVVAGASALVASIAVMVGIHSFRFSRDG